MRQELEGLTALYAALQELSMETAAGGQETVRRQAVRNREEEGISWLRASMQQATLPQTGRNAARQGETLQETVQNGQRAWFGQEAQDSPEEMTVQALSRAVELDARRYDGQISQ